MKVSYKKRVRLIQTMREAKALSHKLEEFIEAGREILKRETWRKKDLRVLYRLALFEDLEQMRKEHWDKS